ncbi:DNA/RNA nuclease SfsA [Litorilinea aerophila]|uniref:Sugar fermentation stimulation protein homolog n=1 Tax=Litorilinea aerophila TaxID=1204385 RepID=A0A540V8L7_9CHLR|nr:DNA/RNA nuclease SfsA [Litorilinea aerophila]MCC9079000.1 DNA/RNA nuclease SfsA [Litorilinea aerophila]OUC09711.1 hypothetical protein RY27_01200 [Litorilinea aerophila]GIV80107.1 MAG: sugar fermentation stimulation protein [Litorilinea sp.]
MRFSFTTEPATFLERPNRFRITARLHGSGQVVAAHCPDPGRMRELLIPGATVHLSRADAPSAAARKTQYDLRFVEHPQEGILISLDTRLPNQLFLEGLQQGRFPLFQNHRALRQEVPLPADGTGPIRSRIDFQLVDAHGMPWWVEVKSITLVEAGCGLFPDAPTQRGRRHVLELSHRLAHGERAAVVFIVQRPDAGRVAPHRATDPAFAQALQSAQEAGVVLLAYTCAVTLAEVRLLRPVPVVMEP